MALVFTALTAMPPGLSLSADGKIAGTPTASFSGAVQIQVSNGAATATGLMSFAIDLPGIPAPILQRRHELEDLTRYTDVLTKVKTVEILSTPTFDRLTVGAIVQLSDFSTPFIEDNLRKLSDFSTPFIEDNLRKLSDFSTPFIERVSAAPPGGFSTAIAIPQGISGLTQIADNINDPTDDHVVNVGDVGFDFSILSIANARNTTCVCSNSHMGFQFATAPNNWNSFAEDYPQQVGLYLGAGDWSHIAIWKGGDTSKFRIRYEGRSDRSGQLPATAIWEVTIWPNGVIMVVTGDFDLTGYTAIQTGFAGESVPFSIGPNTSRVLTPVPAGMFSPATYTVQTGSYS